LEAGEEADSEVFERLRAHAIRVSLTEGEVKTLPLKVR
jgi:hypothetical protein